MLVSLVALLITLSLGASQARATQITGFADENVGTWSAPTWTAFNNTGVKQVRHIVAWNVAYNPGDLATLHAWVNTAQAHGLSVLISFNHNGATPPGVTDYRNAIIKFREEFPGISEYTAWNEPNHHPSSAPNSNPADLPSLAAAYWFELDRQCHLPKYGPNCTVAAGDFLDSNDVGNFAEYIDQYKAKLASYGVSPSVWAIHPYGAVASGNWNALNATFLPRTENKPIWFTEVGAMVCKAGSGLVAPNFPAAEASQNVDAGRLLSLINYVGGRVHRTYYYFLSATNGTQAPCPGFDSGLLGANETIRPAFLTLFPNAVLPPFASTSGVSALSNSQATIDVAVDPRGYHSYYRLDWGPTSGYGNQSPNEYAGFQPGGAGHSVTLSGLSPGATYHYRVVAFSSMGATYGPDQVVQTKAPPVVTTQGAGNVEYTKAHPSASINPMGAATTYHFDYGMTAGYG
ncbi:MAG TPA: fibronectin type III domain-containing protein, partial [Solirubrobacterales bacterium]|nr:fibronectin type III domain-containing protein [Solirubrobacterales bacterium]